ncbi:MAG: NAD(P)-dependent alcohol dehydrogenase [Caldilineaceae bacterium]|nr:NAD(P)-dependent alcohol dehydrogenase [Caldilineaceae bacterium]
MQAILYQRYGSPDVLQLQEVAKPTPQADEVLIKIQAAAANPLDWHHMRGQPFLVRLTGGMRAPKDPRLGADIAGYVEAVGNAVKTFQPGDQVFGEIGVGGFAEYVCAKETALAPKPANLSFAQAAALPVVAFTALQGLRDHGQLQAGQKVLINGASGGVGTLAVQIAKALGADVTGVCSTRNIDLVRGLGADRVIDYTQSDFTRGEQRYDLVYDAVGNRSVPDYRRALTPQGVCVIAGFSTLAWMLQIVLRGSWGGQKVSSHLAQPNQSDLLTIKELSESGKVIPVIDRCYPLAETAEAIRYLETARARGKVIITVAGTDKA